VGPRSSLDGCGKSRPYWDKLPVLSIYTESAIPAYRGKAISLQAYCRPTGFPIVGDPTFLDNCHKKSGKAVSPAHRPPLPSGNISVTHVC
jgi:hypothetical protein